MDPADVPHFMDGRAGPPGMRDANTWLAERGYSLVRQRHPGGIEDLLGIMRRIACDNTGSYYLLTGRSAIGCNLVVIWNDKIVWDPSPDAVGIVGPAFGNPAVGFIVELFGRPWRRGG